MQRRTGGGFEIHEPKTRSGSRQLLLTRRAVEALEEHRRRQIIERSEAGELWEDHDLVFTNSFGRPLNPPNLTIRSFRPLLERAGLPTIRFHDLRHTAATLLTSGIHPKVASEMLGHADVGHHARSLLARPAYDAAVCG